jgi:tetratricopeptide (TPR) repeat protein
VQAITLRFTLAFALLLGLAAGCTRTPQDPAPPPPPSDPARAALEKRGYVGSAACADCHADIAETFSRSAMARSIRPAGRWPVGVTSDPKIGARYTVSDSVAGGIEVREERLGEGGKVVADERRIGALEMGAKHAVSFTSLRPGEGGLVLDELPVTYYPGRPGWALSPGYADANRRFNRPLGPECLFCHNMTPWVPLADVGGPPKAAEAFLGIGCERCHGPGAEHARKGDADTIFNPGDAPAAVGAALCDQCHLHGVARIFASGWDGAPPHPAEPLDKVLSVFVPEHVSAPVEAIAAPIAGQSDRLRLSKCAQASGEKLRCTTCHDPHRAAAELPGGRNAGCAKCHTDDACKRPSHSRAATGADSTADCAGCHMARTPTTDVPHASATDHWIRRAPPTGAAPLQVGEERVAMPSAAEGVRDAHAGGGVSAAERRVRKATAEMNVADAARDEPLLRRALATFDDVLVQDPENALARLGAGYIRGLLGEWPSALEHLKVAVQRAPNDPRALRLLARAYAALEDHDSALAVLERAKSHALDPAEVAYEAARIAAKAGRPDQALALADEAVALRPELPDLRRESAMFRLQMQDTETALAMFSEVCRRTLCSPQYAVQISDMLEAGGMPEAAIEFLNTARANGTPAEGLRPAVVRMAQENRLTEQLVRWLGQELNANPNDLESAGRFADALFKAGQADKAVEVYTRLIDRAGESEPLLRKLGVAQGVAGKLPVAEVTLRRAIAASSSGGEGETWNNLGLALSGMNRKAEAVLALKKATRQAPGFAFGWFNLAMVYEETKRPREGLAAVQEGLRLAPGDEQAQAMRRRLAVAVYGTRLKPAELDRIAPPPAAREPPLPRGP